TIAMLSFMFAPRRGTVSRLFRQIRIKKTINDENTLKTMYQLTEETKNFFAPISLEEILKKRSKHRSSLEKSLSRLAAEGYLEKDNDGWKFTRAGLEKGKRTVKLHR